MAVGVRVNNWHIIPPEPEKLVVCWLLYAPMLRGQENRKLLRLFLSKSIFFFVTVAVNMVIG